MDDSSKWQSDPIHALRLIRRLSDPNQEINDYDDLVRELFAVADRCLDRVDLVHIDSDTIILHHPE